MIINTHIYMEEKDRSCLINYKISTSILQTITTSFKFKEKQMERKRVFKK